MKKYYVVAVVAILLLIASFVGAQQGVGIFARSNCATILNPVTNQTWCFDTSIGRIKVWNGSAFVFIPLVTDPVPVVNGGTGVATLASNGVLIGNGTGNVVVTSAGSANQAFRVPGGGGAPAFGSIALNQSAAVTGLLGTVNGGTNNSGTPTNGQLAVGNGSGYTPATLGITNANIFGQTGSGTLAIQAFLHGQVRLSFVSTTQIKLCPYNGGNIVINGALFQIPSACTTAANTSIFLDGTSGQNLAASTTYFVYLFSNSGTPTIDFSTTGHATDSVATNLGVEIKSGTASRTLVGMIRTNGSSQFEDDNALRGVISWFNRRDIGMVNGFTADRTTASTTYVELNSEIRNNFITWGDEAVIIGATGGCLVSAGTAQIAISIDNSTTPEDAQSIIVQTVSGAVNLFLPKTYSEGFHNTTMLGVASAGTLTVLGAAIPSSSTRTQRTTMTVRIRG